MENSEASRYFLDFNVRKKKTFKFFASYQEIDTEAYPEFDAFNIHPLDGRLNPFEEIKLVIRFMKRTSFLCHMIYIFWAMVFPIYRFMPTAAKLHLLQKQYANSWLTYFAAIIKIVKADVVEIQNVLSILWFSIKIIAYFNCAQNNFRRRRFKGYEFGTGATKNLWW